jgi:hypothetical protein
MCGNFYVKISMQQHQASTNVVTKGQVLASIAVNNTAQRGKFFTAHAPSMSRWGAELMVRTGKHEV